MNNQKKKVHLIGNAHLDPVWLWRWQEGYAEVKATFRSALDRMKEYPHFKFTSACSIYYKWIEETDPQMFLEIKSRVSEGRWCIVGGWIIQPDCNLPSGESFARHSLYAQRYFKEKFDVFARVGYNVDSFGHNGNIPKILRQSKMDSYVFMRPMPHEMDLPPYVFNWESSDGSRVPTHRIAEYYCIDMDTEPNKPPRRDTFRFIENLENEPDMMAFYGVGNHGGGPTKELLDWMGENLEDNFVYSTPNEYFDSLNPTELPIHKSDLQFHAKGCYSVHSGIKSTNRKCENRITSLESLGVMGKTICNTTYPKEEINKAWENVLFNQFHDIMGGCCIKEAMEDSLVFNNEALAICMRNTNKILQSISWSINTEKGKSRGVDNKLGYPVVVFNPLPYPVVTNACIDLRYNFTDASDSEGNPLLLQKIDARHVTWIKDAHLVRTPVPALGYTTIWLWTDGEYKEDNNPFTFTENSISNGIAEIKFDETSGELISYKVRGVEHIKGSATRLYDETQYDTWAHDVAKFDKLSDVCKKGSVKVWELGPVRARLRTVQEIGNSKITRDYFLSADSEQVEVKVKVDFNDRHRILKFAYNSNLTNPSALGEIPFGFMERTTDGSEYPCGEWIAIKDGDHGLGIATDSKSSFSAEDSEFSFVVLRGAIYADHGGERTELNDYIDMGEHEFNYTLFPFKGCGNAKRIAARLNNPVELVNETFHEGALSQEYSFISIDKENIVISAIKEHEDGEGIIVRLYETDNLDTDCTLKLDGKEIPLSLSHSEVKTLLIQGNGEVTETDFIE